MKKQTESSGSSAETRRDSAASALSQTHTFGTHAARRLRDPVQHTTAKACGKGNAPAGGPKPKP